jgi:CofD-related protein of GAK system
VNNDLHLAARMADDSIVVGQHRLTGKETAPLEVPVSQLLLSGHPDKYVPAVAEIRKKNRRLIEQAELICYPPGSFYSSLVANLLPRGVGPAIAAADCPKVYIPNLGNDPEQIGMSAESSVLRLLDYLKAGNDSPGKLLDFVLIDSARGRYPLPLPGPTLRDMGIVVIDMRLVSKQSAPYYDPELLVSALLSLT